MNPTIIIHNATTGETFEREMTNEEYAELSNAGTTEENNIETPTVG
jgi:hypothetical protein